MNPSRGLCHQKPKNRNEQTACSLAASRWFLAAGLGSTLTFVSSFFFIFFYGRIPFGQSKVSVGKK